MMNRRDSLKLMGAASLAALIPGCSAEQIESAASRVAGSGTPELENRNPTILNPHEYQTVTALVDFIIPADDRSGSASDAGVPAFIDFLLEDLPSMETPVRGGIAWLDHWARETFETEFIDCTLVQQQEMLDQIAFPNDAPEELQAGADFFSTMRNLTASGFFSSKMGMEDLQYIGNVARPEWTGCPDEAMNHLGMSYDS